MLRFRMFLLTLVAFVASACGGSGTVAIVGARACEVATDCACPEDTTATCQDKACLCTDTETVPVEGPPKVCESASECSCDSGEEASCTEGICHCTDTETVEVPVEVPNCEFDTDCSCGSSEVYAPSCQEGVCYCDEVQEECYPLTRAEIAQQLMEKVIDLNEFVPPSTPTFTDVPTTHPNYKAIEAIRAEGIMVGYGDQFFPGNALNRAELAKVMLNATDGLIGYTPPAQPSYYDVDPSTWYFDYVEAATQLGLTQGYVNSDGTPTGYYGPGDAASSCFMDTMMANADFPSVEPDVECYDMKRAEFAQQLVQKVMDLSTYEAPATATYIDVPLTHPNFVAIEAISGIGLMTGYTDASGNLTGYFGPDDTVNRAQATKLVIVAIDGLQGYQAPTVPTYADVPANSWFYNYVEAATQLGLTQGYVNSDGTPTGYYGPADTASSCFLDAMMARAEFPDVDTDPISITMETYSGNHNLIVVAGWSDIFSADYKVFGTSATNPLNSVRVINQPDGEGTAPKPTSALSQVYISCGPPSGSGNYTYHTSALDVNGVAEFSNLGCYDETGNGLIIQVSYNVATMAMVGESLSGQVFRLVLDDNRLLGNQENVIVSTVRKSRLVFNNVASSTMLANGERTLFGFQASANPSGSVGLARLSFKVDKNDNDGGGELNLNNFRFYRGSSQVSGVMIHDLNGTNLGGSQNLTGTRVIVTFTSEETIAAGTTQTFTLKATAMGVEVDDSVSSYIYPGDDYAPITGMTSELNPNSGRLVSSIATVGLFPTLSHFNAGNPQLNLSLIWSDKSADNHVYSLADSASSYDWTNGYGHEMWAMAGTTLVN